MVSLEGVPEAMESVVVLALGTRGDVQPLLALAVRLRALAVSTHFITHTAHASWVEEPCSALSIRLSLVTSLPARVWHAAQAESGKLQTSSTLDAQREQCLATCTAALAADGGCGERRAVLVCSLFALEGFHIAEAAGVPCVVASPCLPPYGAPLPFEAALRQEHPALYERLRSGGGGGGVSWAEVRHWMWPLFGERWRAWRHHCLGLPPTPYADCSPDAALPRPPPLLYGKCVSPSLVGRPPYWPESAALAGFWHDARCFPPSAAEAAAALLGAALRRVPGRPVAVDVGSMGRIGLIPDPALLVEALWAAAELTGETFLLLTGGWQPLGDAAAAVLERGGGGGGEEGPPPGLVVLREVVPHDVLLPRCAAVLHHGGAGTVGAALRCGTRQLICPLHFDQGQWAERIEWAGLGAQLPTRLLFPARGQGAAAGGQQQQQPGAPSAAAVVAGAEALAAALSSLLADAETGEACRRMAEALAAEDGAGAAAEAILGALRAPQVLQQGQEAAAGEGAAADSRPALALRAEAVTLPNGLTVACPSPSEALHIYREVWEQGAYLRHGLRLGPAATVVSAGSNVGLFELWLLRSLLPGGEGGGGLPPAPAAIYAFEPVPQLADLLEANLWSHGVSDRVAVIRQGLYSRPCSLPLTIYPAMPGNSTIAPAEKWAAQRPAMLAAGMRGCDVDAAFSGFAVQRCPMTTLAAFVRERGLAVIHLLKVDVEGAELEVFRGMDAPAWSATRQVAAEVHGCGGGGAAGGRRLAEVTAVLEGQGFEILGVDQDPGMACNAMVYAARRGPGQGPGDRGGAGGGGGAGQE